jgi:hypothetical protein
MNIFMIKFRAGKKGLCGVLEAEGQKQQDKKTEARKVLP